MKVKEMTAQCFMLEVTDRVDRKLRRYAAVDAKHPEIPICPLRPGQYSLHDAVVDLDVVTKSSDVTTNDNGWPKDDPRWPTACGCGFVFPESVPKQLFCEHLWRRVDTGELMTLRNAPPGAMWNAEWMTKWRAGPDGKCLVVICPNGHQWMIDVRASNCDSPCANCGQPYNVHGKGQIPCNQYKDAKPHQCWVRHGEPPMLTVDKDGVTCNAGAGSIQTGNWHGFLTNGILSESR